MATSGRRRRRTIHLSVLAQHQRARRVSRPVGSFTVIDLVLRSGTVCDGTRAPTRPPPASRSTVLASRRSATSPHRLAAPSSTWAGRCTGFVPVQTHYVAQSTGARSARRRAGKGGNSTRVAPQSDATPGFSRRGALAVAVAVVEVALAPGRPRGSTYRSTHTR